MSSETKLSERFIGLRELAETLDVTTRTVYRLMKTGLIPRPVKVGRSVRFPVSDVESYIESLKQSR